MVTRLVDAGHWRPGDLSILIVADSGYDITRLAFVLRDLPVELLVCVRSDRVFYPPALDEMSDTPPMVSVGRPLLWHVMP